MYWNQPSFRITQCILVRTYQCFTITSCLHHQSKHLPVPCQRRQQVLLKHWYIPTSRGTKIFQNLGAISKFRVLQRWHEESPTLKSLPSGMTYEPQSSGTTCSTHVTWYTFFLCMEKAAIIMLKIFGTSYKTHLPS